MREAEYSLPSVRAKRRKIRQWFQRKQHTTGRVISQQSFFLLTSIASSNPYAKGASSFLNFGASHIYSPDRRYIWCHNTKPYRTLIKRPIIWQRALNVPYVAVSVLSKRLRRQIFGISLKTHHPHLHRANGCALPCYFLDVTQHKKVQKKPVNDSQLPATTFSIW